MRPRFFAPFCLMRPASSALCHEGAGDVQHARSVIRVDGPIFGKGVSNTVHPAVLASGAEHVCRFQTGMPLAEQSADPIRQFVAVVVVFWEPNRYVGLDALVNIEV